MLTPNNCTVPSGEYMNPAQKSFFESLLLDRMSQVRVAMDDARDALTKLGFAADSLDQAVIEEERQALTGLIARLDNQAREIRAALQAIADDEYGWCEDTGEEIGLERLQAQPTARYSAIAQAHHEARSRQYR